MIRNLGEFKIAKKIEISYHHYLRDNMKTRKKIWNTIKDDFRNVRIDTDVKLDLSEMMDFYLDKEQKKDLSEMKWYKKIYVIPSWLLKILFFKLSTANRRNPCGVNNSDSIRPKILIA